MSAAAEDTPIYREALRAHNRTQVKARAAEIFADVLPTSKAPSARYGVPCPTCGAKADEPCRTRKTRRVTDTHVARIERAGLDVCRALGEA
ncbi:MAG TPA: hypothetical protein VFH56_11165 [Acidimicrobiales bacterium]|nr:hypothetical protein [Acidimicrobiales bacterium]